MEKARCYVVDLRKMRKGAVKKIISRGTVVKCAGLTFVLLSGFEASAFASSDIDTQANKLYMRLLNVGKWVIIFKGALEIVKKTADGDLDSAKKNFMGYGLTYAILWALPWAFNEIDKLFSEMNANSSS